MAHWGFSASYVLAQGLLYLTVVLWGLALFDLLRKREADEKLLWLLILIVAPVGAWIYWLNKVRRKHTNYKIRHQFTSAKATKKP